MLIDDGNDIYTGWANIFVAFDLNKFDLCTQVLIKSNTSMIIVALTSGVSRPLSIMN